MIPGSRKPAYAGATKPKPKTKTNMEKENTNESETMSAEKNALLAQVELNEEIAKHQVETLKLIPRLERIGGKLDYKVTIVEALKAFSTPLSLTFFSQVLPDHTLMASARKALIEKGIVTEETVKNRKMLHLNPVQ